MHIAVCVLFFGRNKLLSISIGMRGNSECRVAVASIVKGCSGGAAGRLPCSGRRSGGK